MFVVPSIHRSGGLALLWMAEIELHVQTFTLHHIDALIMDDPNKPMEIDRFLRMAGRAMQAGFMETLETSPL